MRIMVPSEKIINIEKEKITLTKSNQWTHDTAADCWYYVLKSGLDSNDIVIGNIFVSRNDGDGTDYKILMTLLSNGLYIDTSVEEGDIILYCKINPDTLFTQPYNGFSVMLYHFYQGKL